MELEEFIKQSNLIDTQYDENHKLIPGEKPGDPLYDNHVNAIELGIELILNNKVDKNFPLDIHRELTRGIWYFESQEMSGKYRNYDVWIGPEKLPDWRLVPSLMEERWLPDFQNVFKALNRVKAFELNHYLYESIHPFIDGNGRSGRCIWAAACISINTILPEITYKDRFTYYNSIQNYRDTIFKKDNK